MTMLTGADACYNLIMVAPNCEGTVSQRLKSLEFEHTYFRIRRKVVHRGRLILRIVPLFPGYIFILAQSAWALIESITNVRGLVKFGGNLECCPGAVVCDLSERADVRGVLSEDQLPFQPGDRVQVRIAGVHHTGIFRDYAGPARALVDVDMFGRVCSVSSRLGELSFLE
jgi:hypothetical protein